MRTELLRALKATVDALAGRTLGKDPSEVEGISAELLGLGGQGAPAGMVTVAVAAIAVAMWDIKGKLAGRPLFRLLGGNSNRVRTYASGYPWRNCDCDDLAQMGEHLTASGFFAADPTLLGGQ